MKKYYLFFIAAFLIISCSHDDVDKIDSNREKQETVELNKLQDEFVSLNQSFNIIETRSGDWSWPRFWAITGSDVVGAVVFGLLTGDLWGALGGGVLSSISSYKAGRMLDYQPGQYSPPATNTNNFFATTTFAGYDENGLELYYEAGELEVPEDICIEDELSAHLGTLHNEVIITLCEQYGDSLATLSAYTIFDLSLELVASWYGIDENNVPIFALNDDLIASVILESEDDFDALSDSYPAYDGLFPIVKNYILAISQLETNGQIIAYKAQASNLINSSNLSYIKKETLLSGLDVMVCSHGLWILEEDEEED